MQTLIAAKADVNKTAKGGGTALIAAAAMGHENVVKQLLAAGAKTDGKADIGGKKESALEAAESRGHENIVRILKAVKRK